MRREADAAARERVMRPRCFFFSSRRRHTRWNCDWSLDVCSSDLSCEWPSLCRTTLTGEGLQHNDGHSQLLASVSPACVSYDPAWAYEVSVIVADGLRRMYGETPRSEERRVGKECRSRWSPEQEWP